jgi:hypothetical protein
VNQYAVCRILGNELPPRDLPGSRLATLDYILQNETLGADTVRIWVLNRILDHELLNSTKLRIVEAGEKFVELGIDWSHYIASRSRSGRINALIGINHARNEAFKIGADLARFVFVLDADNYFDKGCWDLTISQIATDQHSHPQRKFYAVPLARVFIDDGPYFDLQHVEREEPALALRKDADQLFDPSASFGQDDKVELLCRLGLRSCNNRWYVLHSEGPCAIVGTVLHLGTGSKTVEHDGWTRYLERRESLNRLLTRANVIVAQSIGGRSVTRALCFKFQSMLLENSETMAFFFQKVWFKFKLQVRKRLLN